MFALVLGSLLAPPAFEVGVQPALGCELSSTNMRGAIVGVLLLFGTSCDQQAVLVQNITADVGALNAGRPALCVLGSTASRVAKVKVLGSSPSRTVTTTTADGEFSVLMTPLSVQVLNERKGSGTAPSELLFQGELSDARTLPSGAVFAASGDGLTGWASIRETGVGAIVHLFGWFEVGPRNDLAPRGQAMREDDFLRELLGTCSAAGPSVSTPPGEITPDAGRP